MLNPKLNYISEPFYIGSFKCHHRLIQAPLAGISCSAFRNLFQNYTYPAYAVSEMISAHSVLNQRIFSKRYLHKSAHEGPLAIQLSGSDPHLLYDSLQRIEATTNPDIFDLNCGCPMPKIRSKGCGSALIDTPVLLEKLIQSMKRATLKPVTVKIRLSHLGDSKTRAIVSLIEQAGADAIIIHGRTYLDDYDSPVNFKLISSLKNHVDIPLIINGDILDSHSLIKSLDETGADAVMIGRGGIGRPWIYQALMSGKPLPKIHKMPQLFLFKQHMLSLSELESSETKALHQGRRLLKWYFPYLSSDDLSLLYHMEEFNALYAKLS